MIKIKSLAWYAQALKEVVTIKYDDGSEVRRIHTPGNDVPEDIIRVKTCNTPNIIKHRETEAYNHHFGVSFD